MSTDLVPVTDYTAELDRVADPGEFVIATVDRAKAWLQEALDHGDIDRIVEIKAQADAIRIYTLSKQLGQDAQLAATEIVRRAERGLGLAIRKGQADGTIATKAESSAYASRVAQHRRQPDKNPLPERKPAPSDFAPREDLHQNKAGIYDLTDGVSDEQFEEAITEGKAERNLSRANVVRKVRNEEKPMVAPAKVEITTAAGQRRAFNGACTTLAGVAHGLRQLGDLHPSITSEEAAEWIDGLSDARLALERVIKRLKERTNVNS